MSYHYPISKYSQGDWLIPSDSDKPDQVREVSYLEEVGGAWPNLTFQHSRDICHLANFCHPIPLTLEILQKNGFEFKDGYGSLIIPCDTIGLTFITIVLRGNKQKYPLYIQNTKGNLKLDLEYVHQLQHILRLYDIDKEITL